MIDPHEVWRNPWPTKLDGLRAASIKAVVRAGEPALHQGRPQGSPLRRRVPHVSLDEDWVRN
jgi:hypothetical protein